MQRIERSNKVIDGYTCILCKTEIVGIKQVMLHLEGRKHASHMMNERANNRTEENDLQEENEETAQSVSFILEAIIIHSRMVYHNYDYYFINSKYRDIYYIFKIIIIKVLNYTWSK